MLKVIELFAGIGAQRKALQKAKIEHEVIAISEIDKYAIQSYNAIYGETPNLGDITKIEKIPKADLWTYSFPCTDISLAGRMNGFEKHSGTHSSLLWEVQRLLSISIDDGTLPKYLLMENVKNLISKKFKPLFDEWCKYLESLGYKNFYKVLNAKDYGIPQNRERVFMISVRDDNALYQFPNEINLDTKLGDYLENNVDEKYYLSTKLINCFTDMKNRNGILRGLQFQPKLIFKDEIARTITTRAGTRPCDNFIVDPVISLDGKVIVPQATKNGYAIANAGDGIYAIDQMMVRAFLIVGTNKALLLDTGAIKIDILKYINEITSLPVEVVLTHGDGDHIGNLQDFKKAYINENDIDAVLSHEECKKVELVKIKEKQIFNIGNRELEVIFTPGHTKGSICLLDKQNKILFSGDTVSYGPIFMFGERRDLSSYLNSLKRLLDLRNKDLFNIVYCCHNLCPIETNTIEDLINCTEGILNKTIEMNNAQMPIPSKEPIKICKYNKCAILIN